MRHTWYVLRKKQAQATDDKQDLKHEIGHSSKKDQGRQENINK